MLLCIILDTQCVVSLFFFFIVNWSKEYIGLYINFCVTLLGKVRLIILYYKANNPNKREKLKKCFFLFL